MIGIKVFCVTILAAGMTACATVPPESVPLSNEIGIGIKKQHQAQVNFLNIYFAAKQKELDAALQRALASYFGAIAQTGDVTLTRDQLSEVANYVLDLNNKNNLAKGDLEKVRVSLVSALEDNYLTLNQANSTITGLLQSAVSVKESTDKSISLVSSATGGKVQMDKIFAEVDAFVAKGGSEAGKAIELSEKIQSLVN